MTSEQYIRRETFVSIAINIALSLAFFLLGFGFTGPVPVWGFKAFVFDFAPQGFMIALMATLVPGALARRAKKLGRIVPLPTGRTAASSLIGRANLTGMIGAGVGVTGAAAIYAFADVGTIGWGSALFAKLVFGGIVAGIATPLGLRIALAEKR
jgi:hypothetical protein